MESAVVKKERLNFVLLTKKNAIRLSCSSICHKTEMNVHDEIRKNKQRNDTQRKKWKTHRAWKKNVTTQKGFAALNASVVFFCLALMAYFVQGMGIIITAGKKIAYEFNR